LKRGREREREREKEREREREKEKLGQQARSEKIRDSKE